MSGGCITKRWGDTLEVGQQVIELFDREPELLAEFKLLFDAHEKRLPKVLRWGDTLLTFRHLDPHRTASILTSCTRGRGLHSACWFTTDRRPSRPPSHSPSRRSTLRPRRRR